MRRFAVCSAIAAILLMPAGALSAGKTYRGTADSNSETLISIRVKKEDGKRYLTRAKAENLAVHCGDGDYMLERAEIKGRVRVRRGEFSTEATSPDGQSTVAVTGKIAKRTITGTFRYEGETRIEDGVPDTPETRDCDSGEVPYTARR